MSVRAERDENGKYYLADGEKRVLAAETYSNPMHGRNAYVRLLTDDPALAPEERRKRLNARVSACRLFEEHRPDLSPDKLETPEAVTGPMSIGGVNEETEFYELLKYFRIPFRELDREKLLGLLREWEDAKYNLSRDTYLELMGAKKEGA